jgi:hypothetical protein
MAECTGSLASQDLSQVQTVSCVQNQLKPIVPIRTLSCSIKTLDVYVLRDKFFVRFTFLFFVNVNLKKGLPSLEPLTDGHHSRVAFDTGTTTNSLPDSPSNHHSLQRFEPSII